MKNVCVGEDKRLRPWLQVVLLIIASLGIQAFVTFIVVFISIFIGMFAEGIGSVENVAILLETSTTFASVFQVIASTLANILTVIVVVVLFKVLNKAKIEEMGLTSLKLSHETKHFLQGLGLGALSISIMVIILLLTGSYTFVGVNFTWTILLGLVLFVAVGFGEEIMVRGGIQHMIARKHKIGWAIFIPSLIFSAMHLGNPNVGLLATFNLFLAGVMLGVITYRTKSLWMAIGWHITWNFTMGNLFGIEVSGLEMGGGLLQMVRVEDNLLNGGVFGLEAGILCTVILLAVTLIVWYKGK